MTSILGTQSIQHPNGTAAATVDASGYLTASQPVFLMTNLTLRSADLGLL